MTAHSTSTPDDRDCLVERLRGDELRSIRNDVETGLRHQILKALDERGRAQELVRQQYTGRYPFELLQNANDAVADVHGGAVAFVVTDTALVVADNGSGFGDDQIRAICGLGRSSKDPRKSIGYKGLGFKSVGEITDRPQILALGAFGFDETRARRAVEELVGALDSTQRLPIYAFPFLLKDEDLEADREVVRELHGRGFTTILRMPFREGVTKSQVEAQVRETITPRLLLFLDATDRLELAGVDGSFAAEVVRIEHEDATEALLQVGSLTEHCLVFRKRLGSLDRNLIDPLGDPWEAVEEVGVALAIRLDHAGRPLHADPQPLHVYFPTEEKVGLSVLLQGDFALELDRRHISRTPEALPYNQWLGGELALLAAEVAERLADRFPQDPAVVGAFAVAGVAAGFGEYLLDTIVRELRNAQFIPTVGGTSAAPKSVLLLPESVPDPGLAHEFLDLTEHPTTALPAVERHQPSRRLLTERLEVEQMSTDGALELIAEPAPDREVAFYGLLTDWSERYGTRRFATQLASIACVHTVSGDWVAPVSGVFFPRQRDELHFPSGLRVPVIALPEVDGLRPVLESAGVRSFEWRQLIPEFVMPLLTDEHADSTVRRSALIALRAYYDSERTGDPRMRTLIGQSLLPACDTDGTRAELRPARSLYFAAPWLGHDRLERIYGGFGDAEFLDVHPPLSDEERRSDRAFYEWMGVSARPRIDERRGEQANQYHINSLGRHPHRAYGDLWDAWRQSPEVQGALACDQGHTTSQQLRTSYALDRLPELTATGDPDRLALLWTELCNEWPRYQYALQAEIHCLHGWHGGDTGRFIPSLFEFALRQLPWIPCRRGGGRVLAVASKTWRITPDTPPRIVERVNVLEPSLDVARSAPLASTLGVVDAARPAPLDLVHLLRDLEGGLEGAPDDDADRDVQLAARWAMRTLNDSLEGGAALEAPVPLLARLAGRHIFTGEPFVASDPLLAETWEPVFPILDADRDLRRLHAALALRDLDTEVETIPDPRRPRPDRRLEVDRWLSDAKPYLAAVAIDQVASRERDIVRGLARLEVSVCEDLVLRYSLDGEVRERPEAVAYIAVRIEQEAGSIIRRRVGTAHLELDQHTDRPHWYALGSQLARFLLVPNLGDAFALLLAADKADRDQYLAARRISLTTVDEARLQLSLPEDDEVLEGLLRIAPDSGAPETGPLTEPEFGPSSSGMLEGSHGLTHSSQSQAEDVDPQLPELDVGSLIIEDAQPGHGGQWKEGGRSRPPGLGPVAPVDHAALHRLQRSIGKRGERAAFEAERRRILDLGRDPTVVVWRSLHHEFAPYDLESQDRDGQQIYIEVKATTSDDPCEPFEISEQEMLLAIAKRSSYYIYRVTSAHTALPQIKRYRDPIGWLNESQADLRLSGARFRFHAREEGGTT